MSLVSVCIVLCWPVLYASGRVVTQALVHGRRKDFFRRETLVDLSRSFCRGEPKLVKFVFSQSKLRKQNFPAVIFKIQEEAWPPYPLFRRPCTCLQLIHRKAGFGSRTCVKDTKRIFHAAFSAQSLAVPSFERNFHDIVFVAWRRPKIVSTCLKLLFRTFQS